MVLSNCGIDAVSLYPTYRRPFDLIFLKAKTEEWRARGDDFRTFLSEFVSILPQTGGYHLADLKCGFDPLASLLARGLVSELACHLAAT